MPDRLLAPIASRHIPWGGVVGTITVHPSDPNRVFIGTQNGGLYRSYDGGRRWGHLDDFPPYSIVTVSYCPSNPDIVLATTGFDTRAQRAGGIWRSNDGGDTWNVPAGTVPRSPTAGRSGSVRTAFRGCRAPTRSGWRRIAG